MDRGDKLFIGGIGLLVVLVLGLFLWAFTTTMGVVERHTDLTAWEFAAIVTLASMIMGGGRAASSRD